jgi:hypothetical protein
MIKKTGLIIGPEKTKFLIRRALSIELPIYCNANIQYERQPEIWINAYMLF